MLFFCCWVRLLLRWGRRWPEVGAVVALEVEGEGVEAADEEEVVVGAVDMVDGSGASVEDIVCRD